MIEDYTITEDSKYYGKSYTKVEWEETNDKDKVTKTVKRFMSDMNGKGKDKATKYIEDREQNTEPPEVNDEENDK